MRKMLYFTESGWTLPDIMQVNEQFDREYDQDEYERKMAGIIAKAYRHVVHDSRDEYDKWGPQCGTCGEKITTSQFWWGSPTSGHVGIN